MGKATEHLLGEGIEAAHLNDDYLGRLLDHVWAYGPSQLFSVVAMTAYRRFGLEAQRYHLDSSRVSVHGAYTSERESPGSIEITHGYSKDHRPDLKQFIVEMICGNDGEAPLAIEVASGNQSDKAVFGQQLKAFAQQWDVDGIRVADSALYSEGNLSELGALRWITRMPLTLSEAQALVTELPSETLEASECEGYRLTCVKRTYAGIPQQWVGVENQARVESDCQQVDKQVDKRRQQAEKAFRQQAQTDFSCAEDALTQAQSLATAWRYHTLDALQVVEHRHYAHPGRPQKGATPTQISYRVNRPGRGRQGGH